MRFFGLKHAGQASMSIDRKAHVAYIVDLGDRKDGDSLKFEGSDISDHLAKHGIRDLAIICSHPHEDHMGGIRRFISTRSNFYTSHNKPRFRQVILIDNVPPQLEGTDTITPLWDIFKNTLGTSVSDPRYSHKSAASYNPLYKMSTIKNDVLVMTIPYEPKDSQAVHDHSVVTLTILHDKNSGRINSVLDPDDASRDVTDKASTQLLSHGIHIDTLIVPHHGSSSNMDDALLTRLHPTWAIFTVNDDNKYGHPYDEVVIRYTAKLGSENVFFTGSDAFVDLNPEGVVHPKYVAKDRSTWEKFVGDASKFADGNSIVDARVVEYSNSMRNDPSSNFKLNTGVEPDGRTSTTGEQILKAIKEFWESVKGAEEYKEKVKEIK